MSNENQKCPVIERAIYGFGDLASCLFWQTITLYLLFFYTDVFGMAAAAAGIMIGVSRLLDAFFDVVIGMTADRTSTRWGKFRPYLLWMAVPLAVSAILAFTTPSFGGAAKMVYAYVTFIFFMFMYSAINIPYTAMLGSSAGTRSKERAPRLLNLSALMWAVLSFPPRPCRWPGISGTTAPTLRRAGT